MKTDIQDNSDLLARNVRQSNGDFSYSSNDVISNGIDHSSITTAFDNLLCGITTLRDRDGVVWPSSVESLQEWQLKLLEHNHHAEELRPVLDCAADDVASDGHRGRQPDVVATEALSPSEWRSLVGNRRWTAAELLIPVVYSWIASGFVRLPTYIQDALRNNTDVIQAVAIKVIDDLEAPPL